MFKFALGAVISVSAFTASFASAHTSEFPEGTLLALEGKDAVKQKDCALFVTNIGYTGQEQRPEQWFATIQTSYSHGSAKVAPITVKIHPSSPGTVFGEAANGQGKIAIFVSPEGTDLRNAKSFNLSWPHGDHLHNDRCVNLKVHSH